MIYHIAEESVWEACKSLNRYVPDEFQSEGFIHCSKLSQVEKTANNYYQGREDLVLLVIDTKKLETDVRYENLVGGEEQFPHVYGAIPKSAITQAVDLKWDENSELFGLSDIS